MSQFRKTLFNKLACGCQAVSVSTQDRARLRAEMVQYSREFVHAGEGAEHSCPVYAWLPTTGFEVVHGCPSTDLSDVNQVCVFDLRASLLAIASGGPPFPPDAIFLLHDAHGMLAESGRDGDNNRSLLADFVSRKAFQNGKILRPIVLIHPVFRIHPDVDPYLEPIPLPLETAREIAEHVVPGLAITLEKPDGLEGPEGADLARRLGEAAAGLPAHQVENLLAECVFKADQHFHPGMLDSVREYRRELINQSGLLRVYSGPERFADVGGLTFLKKFLLGLTRPRPADAVARPRGVMITGIQGCGKSMIAKALANETGRQGIEFNIASLLGGIVGQTEENLRRSLELIDNAGPSVVLVDEVEKSLAGAADGGRSDGGVMSRVLGTLLTWANDHKSDALVIYTANDPSRLPTEFTRAERLDAVFHVDLPTPSDRALMWDAYTSLYRLAPGLQRPKDDDWSGAEVATCTRLAALLGCDLISAAMSVIPVATVHRERVEALRKHAEGRYLDANLGGQFSLKARAAAVPPASRPIRKQQRPTNPEMN